MRVMRMTKAMAGFALTTGAIVLAAGTAGAYVWPGGGAIAVTTARSATMGPAYTGPTPDLAKVANNVSYSARSVGTLVSAPAGLALSEPVTISVGYGNGARITQTYSPT